MEGGKKHHYSKKVVFSHGLNFHRGSFSRGKISQQLLLFWHRLSLCRRLLACDLVFRLKFQWPTILEENCSRSEDTAVNIRDQNTWSISSFGTLERKSRSSLFGFESGAINFFVNLLMPQPITINLGMWLRVELKSDKICWFYLHGMK